MTPAGGRSNCLLFALRMWWRHGGYLIVRRSRYLWLPHFLWAPPGGLRRARVAHYVPISPSRRPWMVWRAALFRGRVMRGECGGCE